jgi:hypothetical protein
MDQSDLAYHFLCSDSQLPFCTGINKSRDILKHLIREQGQSIQTQLFSRFLSFYYDVVHSGDKYVSMCSSICKMSNTNTESNLRLLLYAFNNNGDCVTHSSDLSIRKKVI